MLLGGQGGLTAPAQRLQLLPDDVQSLELDSGGSLAWMLRPSHSADATDNSGEDENQAEEVAQFPCKHLRLLRFFKYARWGVT